VIIQPVQISLEPYEIEWSWSVGIKRHNANLHKNNAMHYDEDRMEDNLRASIAGAVCEIAVAKATGKYWPGSAWDSAQHNDHCFEPDVFPNIEVKRIRSRNAPLVVRKRDTMHADRLIFCAYAEEGFTKVDIRGWLPVDIAWDKGITSAYDKQTRLVDQSLINPLSEFLGVSFAA
jgi:hypothetical protein